MRHYGLGRGKWVFVDWMGVEPGYGTQWSRATSSGFCVPQGISLKVHPPDVDPALVIAPDRPWENGYLRSYCTVIQDGGVLRCWYQLRGGLGYAESDDGITWQKPNLGLVAWNGSTENNLVNISQRGDCVFIDPTAPSSERYKAVGCHWTETERWILGSVSPDGLNWTPLPAPLMKHQHADTQNIALYDEVLGKYVLYTRQRDGVMQRRGINRTESDDFAHFPPSEPVLESNPLDPPDWDFYTNGYARWPGATDAHLMRPAIYQHTPDMVTVHLVTSRDGRIWQRPLGRTPWIGPVPSNRDAYPSPYACAGIVSTAEGEWSFYLGVSRSSHNDPRERQFSQAAGSGFVRATLREDGFTSLSSEGRGSFWTIPFTLNSDVIRVNVRTRYSGFLRCQILASGTGDTGGAAQEFRDIEGYTLDDCQTISGDHSDIPLPWNGSTDVSRLRGQTVRLRFDLYKADLFAIRF